jgi:hypothetical protein
VRAPTVSRGGVRSGCAHASTRIRRACSIRSGTPDAVACSTNSVGDIASMRGGL